VYRGCRVAVVVPAFNEQRYIARVVARMPALVDDVIVVDDGSGDGTADAARACGRAGLVVLRHAHNRGVGAAIVAGYRAALRGGADVVAVMAGDAQMDPADLPRLLDPVASGGADYAMGDRFTHPDCWRVMPLVRFVGGRVLTLLTRAVTGHWALNDSQCGYTAAHRRCLEAVRLERVWPRYGYPNDLLARVKAAGLRVADVTVRPIYEGAESGIRPVLAAFSLSFVLARAWLHRLQGWWLRRGAASLARRARAGALAERASAAPAPRA
jgi:glycosyltransferase involved in cell wall biosynthesis